MKYIILLLGLAAVTAALTTQDHERFRRQVPLHRASSTYPAGTRRTSEGVPILTEIYRDSKVASRNLPPQTDGGISLYNDFVNDPYVSTEDLGSLLSQRHGGRELRTGYQSAGSRRDQIWSSRSGSSSAGRAESQPLRVHGSTDQTRAHILPIDPVNEQGNAWWEVSSKSGDHITYRRRGTGSRYTESADDLTSRAGSAHQTRQGQIQQAQGVRSGTSRAGVSRGGASGWRTASGSQESRSAAYSGASGSNFDSRYDANGDDTWMVASRSDDHITYRKRNYGIPQGRAHTTTHQRGNAEQIQRLGAGEGQVLARVVDTTGGSAENEFAGRSNVRTSVESSRQSGGPQLASYRSMRQHYAHSGPDDTLSRSNLQLKSGDFVSYRTQDGSETVYPRRRGSDSEVRHYRRPSSQLQTDRAAYTERERASSSSSSSSAVPQEFEQQGNWRVISKDNSHITWTRIGSDSERNPTTQRPYTTRQLYTENERYQRPVGSGPHYPMMLERETAERANRVGANNRMSLVY